jgi:hypothetical protein
VPAKLKSTFPAKAKTTVKAATLADYAKKATTTADKQVYAYDFRQRNNLKRGSDGC